MSIAREVATNLLEKGAVKISVDPPFTWSSGIKSPIYCDNRIMIAYPGAREIVVEGFKNLIKEKGLDPDVIGGTATAGIPWAAFLAYETVLPMIYIRAEKKEHGAGKQIEGYLKEGENVLIIEDLISTGGSSLRTAQAVREEGKCTVEHLFAIVTYEFDKAKKGFEDANIELSTLTDFSTLVEVAQERGDLTGEELKIVMDFSADPQGWGERNGF